MEIDKKLLIKMYKMMLMIRYFEDKTKDMYLKGKIRGTIHVSQGQEACAVGGCFAIKESDFIMTTHRGHGHCIAKGVEPKVLLAEILGRATGCCNGRAGSLHAFEVSKGVLGAAAVVGAGLPLAAGVGLGIQMSGEKKVILNYFGDGAANQGTFHEALNLASTWKLPVIFLCENNQIADTTPFRETINIENIADRAIGYGIPGKVVDGNNVLEVYDAVGEAAERARNGHGPTLIECKTYRWEGHHIGDPCVWRRKGELEEWKEKCPIKKLEMKLLKEDIVSDDELKEFESNIIFEIETAAKYAIDSPLPDPETVFDYVWGS